MKLIYRMSLTIIFVISIGFASISLSATAQAEKPSMEDFFAQPDFFRPDISPNGRYLAYVKRDGDEQYVVTIDLEAPNGDIMSIPVGKITVDSLDWLTDTRLLVSVTGFYGRRSNRPVSDSKVREMREEGKILWRTIKSQSQSIVMKRDGSSAVILFDGSPLRSQRRFSAQLAYGLPDDSDHVIMQAPDEGKIHLYKVNINTGKEVRIARGNTDTGAWFVDRNGEAVLRWDFKYRGKIIHSYAKRTTADGGDTWEKVKVGPSSELAENGGEAFRPLAPSNEPDKYYVTARPDGANTVGLYLYDYTTNEYGEPLRADPTRDIDAVSFNRSTLALQRVAYSSDKTVSEYLNPETQAHMDGLQEYFGHNANIVPYASDIAEQKWLLSVDIPTTGITYYLYDQAKRSPIKLGNPNGAMKGKALSDMEIISYAGRDGLPLFGYLSRPVGTNLGDKPPLVVMPHGGPEARDQYGSNLIVQILTMEGYQVFQPQFRGSSGLGLAFADKGRRQWGHSMQHDIDDGFDHLVEQGLANPERACLMGFSYGGYAAFAAATLTPEKYQCILAGAGVSDLPKMLKWERDDGGVLGLGQPRPGSDSYAFKYWTGHIGDLIEDRDAIEATSPARLANRIVRPMFIFHGEDDRTVPIEQSHIMMAAMDRANKPYEWYMMENTLHAYGNNNTSAMETLSRIVSFLNLHLPIG